MCSLLAWTKEEARLLDILIYWEDALLTPHALRSFARGAPILFKTASTAAATNVSKRCDMAIQPGNLEQYSDGPYFGLSSCCAITSRPAFHLCLSNCRHCRYFSTCRNSPALH